MAEVPIPSDLTALLRRLDVCLKQLELQLQPFFSISKAKLEEELSPLERAEVYVTVSQAVNVLFCLLLKTQGISTEDHSADKELERVKLYVTKVENALKKNQAGKPKTGIDIAAANRFIEHAIPDLTPEQRRQVRDVGRQARAAALREASEGTPTGGEHGGTDKGKKRPSSERNVAAEAADVLSAAYLELTAGSAKMSGQQQQDGGASDKKRPRQHEQGLPPAGSGGLANAAAGGGGGGGGGEGEAEGEEH